MTAPRPFAEVVEELKRLDAAATPGPLSIQRTKDAVHGGLRWRLAFTSPGLPNVSFPNRPGVLAILYTSVFDDGSNYQGLSAADCAKLEACYNALPALLARAAVFEAAVAWDDVRQSVDDDGADSVSLVRRMIEREKDLRAAIARALAAENQLRAGLGEETK